MTTPAKRLTIPPDILAFAERAAKEYEEASNNDERGRYVVPPAMNVVIWALSLSAPPDEAAAFRRLYLDCDGVLADFDAAFIAKFGHTPRDYENANGQEVFWRDIRNEAPTFYRDLPLMTDAMELFTAVKHMRPIILTGVPRGEWAELQKLAWAAKHFPGVPMQVCQARNKRDYCQPGDVLIDDRDQYRSKWEDAGGVFIHHKSAAESLHLLAALGVQPPPTPAKPEVRGK